MATGSVAQLPPGFEVEAAPHQLPPGFEVEAPAPASIGPGTATLGVAEQLGSQIGSIPHAISHAVTDLASRLTAGHVNIPEIPAMKPGEAGRQVESAVNNSAAGKAFSAADQGADRALESFSPTLHDVVHQTGDVAGDVAALTPVAEGAAALARPGKPPLTPPAETGFRTANDSKVARTVAGPSGREALSLHNQEIGNTLGNTAGNVPHGTELSYEALEAGREAPNAVYGRIASQLPSGPLSPKAQQMMQSAGGVGDRITSGSPDAANAIESLKTELTNAHSANTGEQVVNEMRGLRQEGYVNIGSDDVSKQQLGKAQLDMSRALEQHVNDTLPANADVSMDQLKTARTALAQNHAVQAALRGKDIDMQAVARIQRADPDLLSGPLKHIADFANASPEVSSLPSASARYSPPSLLKDAAGFDIMHPIGSAARVLGGGPLARRVLTGNTDKAVDMTRQNFPTGGLADRLAPIDRTPQAPDLGLGVGANPNPSSVGGHPGDISLADLLAHGVEQSPSPGLSLAPDSVPHASGVPFNAPPEAFGAHHLSLADALGGAAGHEDTSGLAHVLSQGVPEGVMTKAGKHRFIGDTVDFPGGTERRRLVDLLEGR